MNRRKRQYPIVASMAIAVGFLVLIQMCIVGSEQAGPGDDNLIEYSIGPYSDAGGFFPMPWMVYPPIMRISEDGVIVRCPNADLDLVGRGCVRASVAPDKLQKLRVILSKNKSLRHSRYIPSKKGGLLSMGGGIFYVRYKSGPDEVILGTGVFPVDGPIADLVKEIRKSLPELTTPFVAPANWYDEKRLKQVLFELYSDWKAVNEKR